MKKSQYFYVVFNSFGTLPLRSKCVCVCVKHLKRCKASNRTGARLTKLITGGETKSNQLRASTRFSTVILLKQVVVWFLPFGQGVASHS